MHDAEDAGHAGVSHLGEIAMRKSALLLATLMVAAAPTAALAAKAKAAADPNANGKKFVAAAFQQPGHILKGMMTPWWTAKKK